MSVFLPVGPNLPSICVEVDTTTNPTSATRVWTDITASVRSIGYASSGRNTELQRSSTGTATFVCGNIGGAISALGINKREWIRIRAQWLGVTYPVWQGIIEQVPRTWPSAGKDDLVQFTAAGPMKVLKLCPLQGVFFPQQRNDQRFGLVVGIADAAMFNQIMANSPLLYWRLNEPLGATVAADSSGNGNTGTYTGVALAQPGDPYSSPDTSVRFDGLNSVITTAFSPYILNSSRTFLGRAWRPANLTTDFIIGSTSSIGLSVATNGNVTWFNASSGVTWTNAWPGTGGFVAWALTYNDTTKVAELFINGVSQGAQTLATQYGVSGAPLRISGSVGGNPWDGFQTNLAIFGSILGAATIANLAVPYTSWLAGPLDTLTDVADAVTLSGLTDALSYVTSIEESENGLVVETPDGLLSFQGRRYRGTNSVTPIGTFSETQIPYTDSAQFVDDDALMANTATVTPLGGTAVTVTDSSDATSRWKSYISKNLISSSASLALAAAQWLVGRYKNPAPRIPTLEVNLLAARAVNPNYVATLLGTVVSSRYTWKRAATVPIQQDVYVEKITGKISPGQWSLQFDLSPAGLENDFILDNATRGVLGGTATLAY